MKNNTIIKVVIFLTFILLTHSISDAQDKAGEKKSPDLSFVCKKMSDGGYELKARLSLFENRKDFAITGEQIDFRLGEDTSLIIKGNRTDKSGYATAIIKPGVKILKNKSGIVTGKADYSGSNKYNSVSAEISFTETEITVDCIMVDTVKTVKVAAVKINADGSRTPLSGEKIMVSVQRMFSRLPIGEVTMGEDGTGTVEFPAGLPGDSIGNLKVVAYIADHELYGNIDKENIVKWGIPKQQVMITHRALWTQVAPVWMIISLTILLVGVWAHYLYVFIQLRIVKSKGNQI